jgi:hypothetical protein
MMFADLVRAFGALFTERRSRAAVVVLLVAMAAVPVAELLVIRSFSHLIVKGPDEYKSDHGAVLGSAALFFAGFAVTRGLHHLVRFWRVRIFRAGFASSGLQRTPGQSSWEWALAFEVSTVCVGLIQVITFGALFVWINPLIGFANAALCAAALYAIARIYDWQLVKQFGFVAEPAATTVSERIATRVFAAEAGSILATAALALMMALVLWRTLTQGLAAADAIVLFLGLRLLYGHVGTLSPSAMRFARAASRQVEV